MWQVRGGKTLCNCNISETSFRGKHLRRPHQDATCRITECSALRNSRCPGQTNHWDALLSQKGECSRPVRGSGFLGRTESLTRTRPQAPPSTKAGRKGQGENKQVGGAEALVLRSPRPAPPRLRFPAAPAARPWSRRCPAQWTGCPSSGPGPGVPGFVGQSRSFAARHSAPGQ